MSARRTRPRIASYGLAVPAPVGQQELWDGYFAEHYDEDPVARRLFRSVGVHTRHGVVSPLVEDVSGWSTSERMRRWAAESLPLGKEAATAALTGAGVDAEELGLLVVASCTGYTTPGLHHALARDLGAAADLRTLPIGHLGCHAALPALDAATADVLASGRPALVLCLELTSLHLQPRVPPTSPASADAVQQMVAHALFGDAAAAVVVRPGEPAAATGSSTGGLEVVEVASCTDTSVADLMTWEVGDHGFRMGLSPEVPAVLGRHARPTVTALLDRHGLVLADIPHWVVHPGGPAIIDTVGAALGLTDPQLQPSRDVLGEYGNCSSPTVLLILERVAPAMRPGEHAVVLAFGPGLSLVAALLRAT